MITIRIRGHANAQAVFDIMHGRGVTWREPFGKQGPHTITVERCSTEDARKMLDDLKINKATIKEF